MLHHTQKRNRVEQIFQGGVMEDSARAIIEQLSVTGGLGTILFFIVKSMINSSVNKFSEQTHDIEKKSEEIAKLQERAVRERKAARDSQIADVKQQIARAEEMFGKHIARHNEWEKSLCGKIDKLYDRINPLCDSINKIQGYLEGKNVKSQ